LSKPDSIVTLDSFPKKIGEYSYVSMNRFSKDIEEMLGADAYIDYHYTSSDNREVEVLVSYFSSMYEGKQYHSPKNCMLGSGWETLDTRQVNINWQGRQVPVNFMTVRKNSQFLYVIYWIQGRGRLMASEYQERFYRVIDSFMKSRTDGVFVRITLPGKSGDSPKDFVSLTKFAEYLAVDIGVYLP